MDRISRRAVAADRLAECADAIELSHIDLVNKAVANGWTEREVAAALFSLASAHLDMVGLGAGEAAARSNVA